MANLQIKNVADDLYEEIKKLASAENRSVSHQVLFLVKEYLAKRKHLTAAKSPAQVLLELSGYWEDDRNAEQIVREIKSASKSSRKLEKGF